ncbi:MAG: cation diffusion facilitator family transporter [Acidimicrobiales bacterium]
MSGSGHGKKAIAAAFLANLGIAIAKFIGFLITRSSSLLAESVHSLADTGNQGLLLLGDRRASRHADEQHPFGYSRERYWAFVVALVLFIGGAVFAIYEGVEKIRHPHEIESPAVAIAILVLGVGLEGFSFTTAMREAAPLRQGRSWFRFIRESRSPELPVVLLEDSGALVGLVIALAGVVLATTTEHPIFDGIGTLTIGLLLALIAVVLAVEMKSLLIGEAATTADTDAIRRALAADASVVGVIHLRTEHLGPDDVLVATKLAFRPKLTVAELAAAIDAAEVRVRAAVPAARLIYIEPDLQRSS